LVEAWRTDGMGAGAEPVEAEEGAAGKEEKAAVSCSICLDAVVDAAEGERSTARLQCGHEFHLGKPAICSCVTLTESCFHILVIIILS
jgi:hypothetical protein